MRDAPTRFGKVSYTIARRGRVVTARLVIPAGAHARLRLRLPAGEHVERVVVGGRRVPFDAAGTIELGSRRGAVAVRATVR